MHNAAFEKPLAFSGALILMFCENQASKVSILLLTTNIGFKSNLYH